MKPQTVEGIDTNLLERFPIEQYQVKVVDGDTITLSKGKETVSVRLAGIDTPETKKKGVEGAAGAVTSIAYLQQIVNTYRSQLQLYVIPGETTHGRLVGVLVVGKMNVNLALVKRGLSTTFSPEGGIPGVHMGKFRAAERKAVKERKGLFESESYRIQFALNRTMGDVANVRMQDTSRLEADYAARIRAGTIKGLRSSSHHQNVPHGIQGMNVGHPDFPGGRWEHNANSMELLQDQDAYRKAQGFFRRLSNKASFNFLDVETTGLRAQEFVTEFALQRDEKLVNVALTPALNYYTRESSVLGLEAPYDSDAARRAGNRFLYRGSRLLRSILPGMEKFFPGATAGENLTMKHMEHFLDQSTLDPGVKAIQREHLKRLRSGGQVMDLDKAVGHMFSDIQQQLQRTGKSEWMFIHNPFFESRRLGAAMGDEMWEAAVKSGTLAAGSTSFKSIFQQFDEGMMNMLDQAREIERMVDKSPADLNRSRLLRKQWFTRLSNLLETGGGPKGLKVVDVQDIAKSVFAMAGLHDESLALKTTHGMMSQDLIGRMMGLSPEQHTAYSDVLQSKIVTANLLRFGQNLQAGQMTDEMLEFFGKAADIQPAMSMYALQKDLVNRINSFRDQGIDDVNRMFALVKEGELSEKELTDFYVGGKKTKRKLRWYDLTDEAAEAEVPLVEYAKIRAQRAGIDISEFDDFGKEVVEKLQATDLRTKMGKVTQAEVMEAIVEGKAPMIKLGIKAGSAGTVFEGLNAFIRMHQPTKAVPDGVKKETIKAAADKVMESIRKIPFDISEKWKLLPSKYKAAVGIGTAAMGAVGLAGAVRSTLEEEHGANPDTLQLEAYMVNREMQDFREELSASADMREILNAGRVASDAMLRAQKSPGRYYPSRNL